MKIAAKRCEHCDGILWHSQFAKTENRSPVHAVRAGMEGFTFFSAILQTLEGDGCRTIRELRRVTAYNVGRNGRDTATAIPKNCRMALGSVVRASSHAES